MSKRSTSIEAYHQVKECGWIGEKQLQVYEALYELGPSTSAEVFRHMWKKTGAAGRNVLTQSRARFTELREMDVIEEAGTRKCNVTGRNVILWKVTLRSPVRPEKRAKKSALLRAAEARVAKLEAALRIAKEWDEMGNCELPPYGEPRLSEICDQALEGKGGGEPTHQVKDCPRCSHLYYKPDDLIEGQRQRAREWEGLAVAAERKLKTLSRCGSRLAAYISHDQPDTGVEHHILKQWAEALAKLEGEQPLRSAASNKEKK